MTGADRKSASSAWQGSKAKFELTPVAGQLGALAGFERGLLTAGEPPGRGAPPPEILRAMGGDLRSKLPDELVDELLAGANPPSQSRSVSRGGGLSLGRCRRTRRRCSAHRSPSPAGVVWLLQGRVAPAGPGQRASCECRLPGSGSEPIGRAWPRCRTLGPDRPSRRRRHARTQSRRPQPLPAPSVVQPGGDASSRPLAEAGLAPHAWSADGTGHDHLPGDDRVWRRFTPARGAGPCRLSRRARCSWWHHRGQ